VLCGKRIVITGAAGGAGWVTAELLANAGAQVVVSDVSAGALETGRARRPDMAFIRCDAGSEDDVASLFDFALRHLGGLDVLVNNVGIAGPTATAEDVSLADWNRTLAVNVGSHFLCAKRAIPLFKSQRSGAIVNVSSMSAKLGLPWRLPYVVSKAAVLGLTRNLARELGPFGIRVNAVMPGVIEGERIRKVIESKSTALGIPQEQYASELVQYSSMRTMVTAADVGNMILFLASDAAARISGQAIAVDGDLCYET
jgi:NAD(P)-dependent dehydrogenase (short-subunit alcohol dehydrogenase family)